MNHEMNAKQSSHETKTIEQTIKSRTTKTIKTLNPNKQTKQHRIIITIIATDAVVGHMIDRVLIVADKLLFGESRIYEDT